MSIAIAVIAILAAAMIPAVSGIVRNARIAADKQTAASLSTQLALWELDNGEIDSAQKLYDAIGDYYDNIEEVLTPKSAKNGYHFWYDPTEKQIILSTYDELSGSSASSCTLLLLDSTDAWVFLPSGTGV